MCVFILRTMLTLACTVSGHCKLSLAIDMRLVDRLLVDALLFFCREEALFALSFRIRFGVDHFQVQGLTFNFFYVNFLLV